MGVMISKVDCGGGKLFQGGQGEALKCNRRPPEKENQGRRLKAGASSPLICFSRLASVYHQRAMLIFKDAVRFHEINN